jgi:hypothetical protein
MLTVHFLPSLDFVHQGSENEVGVSQYGSTQKESQVATQLAQQTGPVADPVLLFKGEGEVLEPKV